MPPVSPLAAPDAMHWMARAIAGRWPDLDRGSHPPPRTPSKQQPPGRVGESVQGPAESAVRIPHRRTRSPRGQALDQLGVGHQIVDERLLVGDAAAEVDAADELRTFMRSS